MRDASIILSHLQGRHICKVDLGAGGAGPDFGSNVIGWVAERIAGKLEGRELSADAMTGKAAFETDRLAAWFGR